MQILAALRGIFRAASATAPLMRARAILSNDTTTWHQASGPEQREAPPRAVLNWTPVDIRNALVQADGGSLYRVAQLCDAILGDDRAAAVLATRRNALFGSRLLFDPANGRRKGMAVLALEAEEDWWTMFPEEDLGRLLTWGWLLGVGVGELVLPPPEAGEVRAVPRLKVWHPSALRFDWPTRTWRLKTEAGEITITPGDGKWVLFTPYGASRPWAHGLWRGMARLWLLKQYALDDWGRHSEVHGIPMRVGFAQGDGKALATKENRLALAADLAQLGRETSIALPPGFDFKLVEAQAGTWPMFKAQIDLTNSSMSIMAIGGNMSTELSGSAGTGATAQSLVRQDYKRTDGETTSTFARAQVLVHWALWNFHDASVAPWPRWDFEPPSDQVQMANVVSAFATACETFGNAGIPVNVNVLAERFNVPLVLATPGEIITPKPPAQPKQLAPKPPAPPAANLPVTATNATSDDGSQPASLRA